MSKFCTTCGATLEDNATFCTNCGTPQEVSAQNAVGAQGQTPAASAADAVKNTFSDVSFKSVKDSLTMDNIKNITKNPNKNTIIGLSVIGVVAITVIIILCVVLFGGAYKKPIDKVIKAYTTGEGKYYVETLYDLQQEAQEETFVDKSKKYDTLEEYYDERMEQYNEQMTDRYGDGFKIKYKITKKKEASEKQLKSLRNALKEVYDEKVDVSAMYTLTLEVTWKGPDDEDEDDRVVTVAKINGTWTLYSGNLLPKKLGGSSGGSAYDWDDIEDMLGDLF